MTGDVLQVEGKARTKAPGVLGVCRGTRLPLWWEQSSSESTVRQRVQPDEVPVMEGGGRSYIGSCKP